ncbi:hypothetical protein REPUB_Repub05bG0044600 [Reevesia pubescens]
MLIIYLIDDFKWWRGLDIESNFPFARDRLVECYMWILGVYFEPHYSIARTFMTKVIALTSILDDTYDAYGTYEELDIFTKAIHRWDISCIDQLPDYMKVCYREMLNVYKEMEDLMAKQGKSYRVQLAKEAMKNQCQAYYVEAKWLNENHTPTMEEYMSIALVSCGYHMLAITSFVGMEDTITKETFVWAFNAPKILRASTIVNRLMSDIVSHKVMGDRSGNIRWWDVTTGHSSSFNTHREGIRRIKFSPIVAGDHSRGDSPDPLANSLLQPQFPGTLVLELDWLHLRTDKNDPLVTIILPFWFVIDIASAFGFTFTSFQLLKFLLTDDDINEEFLKPTTVPEASLTRILNLTRVIDLLYKEEDAYTNVGGAAKTSITSLLIDPIPI